MGPWPILKKVEHKILTVMNSTDTFALCSPASLLWTAAWLYGAGMHLRRSFYEQGVLSRHRLRCFVISVGNLCLGGTGKTPMVLHLTKLLQNMGCGVAVVSRGYKGLCEKAGAVVSDGCDILCDARHAGDEPYLMAKLLPGVPVVVGADRVAAGRTAVARFHPDVLILDDGFQHLRLHRDLNLLLLDGRNPFGNSYVLPRGILREPQSALRKADAVILTRCDNAGTANHYDRIKNLVSWQPVFRSFHRSTLRAMLPAGQLPVETFPGRLDPDFHNIFKDRRVFAFSGLAQNQAFQDSVRMLGAKVVGTLGFEDHHHYSVDDVGRIAQAAQSAGSDCLVTTDKDYVRWPPEVRFPLTLIVLGVGIDFAGDQEDWKSFIAQRVKKGMRF